MAIAGINTGSGYSGYTGGGGIGALGRETINRTAGNAEFGRKNVVESEKYGSRSACSSFSTPFIASAISIKSSSSSFTR